MKIIYSFLIGFLLTSVSIAAPSPAEIKGNYFQSINGRIELVAQVYQYAGAMKVKFFNGCSAVLERKAPYWEGGCATGSGYNSAHYLARVKKYNSQYVLLFKVSEYGDNEIPGFSEYLAAYKK